MSTMEIVDGQLHELGPVLDWSVADDALIRKVISEVTLSSMDAVGVDAAVLHPWQADASWASEMAIAHPGRFASVITLTDFDSSDFDDRVADLRSQPGAMAARLIAAYPESELERLRAGAFDAAFAACERHGLPLFVFISGAPGLLAPVAEAHPGLQLVVDHLGIKQPPVQPNDAPFDLWPELLGLAHYPNILVKLCGLPVFSAEGFPFSDVWPRTEELLEAFGVERVLWASDIGRFRGRIGLERYPEADAYPGKHTYADALGFIKDNPQLSVAEKAQLLGGTVRRLLGWAAPGAAAATVSTR